MGKSNERTLVYSSGDQERCPTCGVDVDACRCGRSGTAPRGDGIVRVGRETKGRKGAGVTVVSGVALDDAGLKTLAGELKRACGSGGTVRGGVIEIQGEHRDRLVSLLQGRGWTVKRAGG